MTEQEKDRKIRELEHHIGCLFEKAGEVGESEWMDIMIEINRSMAELDDLYE